MTNKINKAQHGKHADRTQSGSRFALGKRTPLRFGESPHRMPCTVEGPKSSTSYTPCERKQALLQ